MRNKNATLGFYRIKYKSNRSFIKRRVSKR